MIKYVHDSGVNELTFKQLNKYLQNANQELITYDLLSLMFDEDVRLQSIITSITPEVIKLGKKTDDDLLSKTSDMNQMGTK